jgi:hypothetical protein
VSLYPQQNRIWIDPGANPGLCGERPVANHLSHGTASIYGRNTEFSNSSSVVGVMAGRVWAGRDLNVLLVSVISSLLCATHCVFREGCCVVPTTLVSPFADIGNA